MSFLALPVRRAALPQPTVEPGLFRINFVRHDQLSPRVVHGLRVAAIVSCAVNALVLAGLMVTWIVSERDIRRSRRELVPLGSARQLQQELGQMDAQAQRDLAKLQTLLKVSEQKFHAAGRLAALTRTLPARTWITGIQGTREDRSLIVRALYLVNPDLPYELPTRQWVEALRADPQFGPKLSRLDVARTEQVSRGRTRLAELELVAEWKQ